MGEVGSSCVGGRIGRKDGKWDGVDALRRASGVGQGWKEERAACGTAESSGLREMDSTTWPIAQ